MQKHRGREDIKLEEKKNGYDALTKGIMNGTTFLQGTACMSTDITTKCLGTYTAL
jgi:hypothetical protein